MSSDDDDGAIGGDGRQRRAAPVEEHEVGSKADGDARSVSDVRGADRSCEPSTASPTANGRHTDESGGLEVIRCGMTPRSRERNERVDRGRHGHDLGLGRPSSPHRDNDDASVDSEKPRNVTGHGGLADALTCPDDGDRRELEGLAQRRIETEVRSDIRQPQREDPAREREALDGAEHRLVREVDDHVRSMLGDCGLHVGGERNAVLLSPAQLLVTPDQNGRDELVRQLGERVTHDGGVVLAVDDGESPHVRAVTSSSIAPVNFAYSRVSRANETSFTWPWNG